MRSASGGDPSARMAGGPLGGHNVEFHPAQEQDGKCKLLRGKGSHPGDSPTYATTTAGASGRANPGPPPWRVGSQPPDLCSLLRSHPRMPGRRRSRPRGSVELLSALLDDGVDAAAARRLTVLGQPIEETEVRKKTPGIVHEYGFWLTSRECRGTVPTKGSSSKPSGAMGPADQRGCGLLRQGSDAKNSS